MGESDRYYEYRGKKFSLGTDGNALTILICINAVLFLTITFARIVYSVTDSAPEAFENEFLQWFILPAKVSFLTHRPWTIITYMFSHTGLVTAITNMLWLWAFGSIFQQTAGNRKLIPIYLYGGLAGAAAFIAANYFIPSLKPVADQSVLEGSAASIMAVAVATTTLTPDYRFFKMMNGGIPLWVLTMLFVIIDFAGIASKSAAYNVAHLAGALTGFLFILSLRKGNDWSLWMGKMYDWINNLFNPDNKPVPVKRIKEKVFYKTGNQKPFIKKSAGITQQRVDEILDKINQQGYQLLTEEEINILKKAADTDL
ncbi:MAG: rhomboid family intramembrane serine protease [Chitinophagaceae bacterium]|nr:rhomboid family intramembrane serine protease [Chitinophagaceae bacterium]